MNHFTVETPIRLKKKKSFKNSLMTHKEEKKEIVSWVSNFLDWNNPNSKY